jgi:hypothetical protein
MLVFLSKCQPPSANIKTDSFFCAARDEINLKFFLKSSWNFPLGHFFIGIALWAETPIRKLIPFINPQFSSR